MLIFRSKIKEMAKDLIPYQPERPLKRAIEESAEEALVVLPIATASHYLFSPSTSRNFEDSLRFGFRQSAKQFLQSLANRL